jgi:hypothetical protein
MPDALDTPDTPDTPDAPDALNKTDTADTTDWHDSIVGHSPVAANAPVLQPLVHAYAAGDVA